MKTIRQIMDANSNQSLVKWADGVNKYAEEKVTRFVVWGWVDRNSVPPNYWEPFVKYAQELGADIGVEDIYEIWIQSSRERAREKVKI